MLADDLINQIIIVMVWIGMWGIIENIIEKYVPGKSYNLRIVIYVIILVISLFLVKTRKIYLEGTKASNETEKYNLLTL